MRVKSKRYWRILLALALGLGLVLVVVGLAGCGKDLSVETQSLRTKRHTFQDAVVATGNGTLLHTSGYPYLSIDVAGIVTATVSFEQTVNGTDWRAFQAVNTSDGSVSTTATANGTWVVGNIGVYDYVRVRVSSWTAGMITVMGQAMESVGESLEDVEITTGSGLEVVQDTAVDLNMTEASASDIKTAVEKIDDPVSGLEMLIAGGATQTNDVKVSLDGEVVAADVTGQGDVPISTSRDLTVTLDSETVTVDSELAAAAALADAAANPTVPTVGGAELLYNEATWDRARGNTEGTLLASAARTATVTSTDTTNYNNNSGLLLFIDVTSITASPSVTAQLDWKDPASGDYEPVWIATVAIVGTGEYIYMFGLGGVGSAGEYDEAVNILIPRTFRLTMTHADSDSITYSVGYNLLN